MTAMDAFFAECGGREPLRVELRPRGSAGVTVEFRKPCLLVGRGPGTDIGDDSPATPPRHLYFQLVAGRLYAIQLPNDTGPPESHAGPEGLPCGWVYPDEAFRVRGTELRVLNPIQDADLGYAAHLEGNALAVNPMSVVAADVPLFTLDCGYATVQSQRVPNHRPLLLIGRSVPSKIRVRHRSLCPVHAAIVATGRGFWVVDLSAEGGVEVNGAAVAVAPLAHGDVFHCGKVPFRFDSPGRADAPRVTGTTLAPRRPPAPAARATDPQFADAVQVGTVLDQVAQVQQHSFEQFRQMLGTVMQMVSVVMADQRAFVKDELDRMERMMTAVARSGQSPPVASPGGVAPGSAPTLALPPETIELVAPPRGATSPRAAPPPPAQADVTLHNWVDSQLQSLQRDQDTLWKRLKRSVGSDGPKAD